MRFLKPAAKAMIEPMDTRKNHLVSLRLFVTAAAFGCVALLMILAGFHIQVPGLNSITDPREIFVVIGAALTGPVGGIVIGILSGLGDPHTGAHLYIIVMHVLGAVGVGWAYKRLVHDHMPMPYMLIGWAGVVFAYYFILPLPVIVVTRLVFPEYFLQVLPEPLSLFQTILVFYRGWFVEYVFTTVLTAAVFLALPRRARAPMWWTSRHPQVIASIHARPPRNIIALRLTLWVLLLSCVPMLLTAYYLRDTITDLYVEYTGTRELERLAAHVRGMGSPEDVVGLMASDRLAGLDSTEDLFILDGSGCFAWHPDSTFMRADARALYGKRNVESMLRDTSGYVYEGVTHRCFIFMPLPGTSQRLVLATNIDIGTTLLKKYESKTMLRLGVAILLVAIIAGVVIWLLIGRPMRSLAHAARRVGHNDLEVQVDPEMMSDEVGILGQAFNEMTENLAILHEGLKKEIEDRRATEQALRESERRFRDMADLLPLTVYEVDLSGHFLFTNRAASAMFHFGDDGRPEHLIITDTMIPEERERARENMRQVCESGGGSGNEYTFLRLDGSTFPGLIFSSGVRDGERTVGMRGIVIDITEQRRAQQALQSSVTEKEVMLQEIHHRVKNNLQIVSSLLSLQSSSMNDPTDLTLFQESVDRIRSMALIHDRLYKSRDLVGIEFREYIESLVMSLFHSYGRPGITYNADVQDVRFAIDTAIPFGLIINELVTNALKHAFPDGRQGTITVSLAARITGEVALSVSDDGVGLPPNVDVTESASLGLQLVKILTDQLTGTLEISSEHGTTFSVLLPPLPVRNGTIGATPRA